MSLPLTGFEASGEVDWTTNEQEADFLNQIAADTDAVLTEIGRTVGDLPIHRIDIGTGQNTLLFIGLQHANEPAGREAALELIRDLAYSNDPQTLNYLASNRVILIPSLNADGNFRSRNNRNGVNLNRDWFQLTQPETRAAHAVMKEVNPSVVVDLHESGMDHEDWTGTPEIVSGSYDVLSALGEDLYESVVSGVQSGGYTAGRYPRTSTPVSGASTAAGALHSVGLISEPLLTDRSQPDRPFMPRPHRVDVCRFAVRAVRQWHERHALSLMAAKQSSMQYAITTTDPILLNVDEMTSGSTVEIDAIGYQLIEPFPEHLADAHGIHIYGSYIPLNQPARLAIAMLCDPESRDKVVASERLVRRRPEPRPSGYWSDTWVMIAGARRRVRAWRVEDGVRKTIRVPTKL